MFRDRIYSEQVSSTYYYLKMFRDRIYSEQVSSTYYFLKMFRDRIYSEHVSYLAYKYMHNVVPVWLALYTLPTFILFASRSKKETAMRYIPM